MTKKELIEALKDLPDDAIVTRANINEDEDEDDYYIDYLDLEEVDYKAESNKIMLY